MQAMCIGDAALVSVPLEPFAHTGAAIRELSPFPVTQFAGYANGLIGYVPEAADFSIGGYEVELAGPFTEAAAEVLIARRSLRSMLWRRRPEGNGGTSGSMWHRPDRRRGKRSARRCWCRKAADRSPR